MCRGCETACPSGVQFGPLMEQTRVALAEQGQLRPPRWLAPSLKLLGHHRLLLLGSSLLGVAQRLHLVPDQLRRKVGLPHRIAIRREKLEASKTTTPDVWLVTGCVMDAWQRDVHVDTVAVLKAVGAHTIAVPSRGGDCCGALHLHGGLADAARVLATKMMRSMPGSSPVLVNSAGCGAALKEYGHLLGTSEAVTFAARVFDVHEWIVGRLDRLPVLDPTTNRLVVAIQDPCHLRHVQKSHLAVRDVLARFVEIREIADDGRCCGAGGSYSITQPEFAGEIRTQKVAAIRATGALVVASANPGCSMWLADAPSDGAPLLSLRHPMSIVAEALRVPK